MTLEKPEITRILDSEIRSISDAELQETMYRLTEFLEDVFEYYDTYHPSTDFEFQRIGINTEPDDDYRLKVNGPILFQSDLTVDANVSADGLLVSSSPTYATPGSGQAVINNALVVGQDSFEAGFEIHAAKSGKFSCMVDGSVSNSDESGLYWHNTLDYAIFRTTGFWNSPDYQQLQINFTTGIILNGGSSFGKSYVRYVNHPTTSSSANMYMASGGAMYRSTSSGLYKRDVRNLPPQAADRVLNLRPVKFKSENPRDPSDKDYLGLIAEEVAEVEPLLVDYQTRPLRDDNGEIIRDKNGVPIHGEELYPESVNYQLLGVMLLDVLNREKQGRKSLETRVGALERGRGNEPTG